MSTSTIPIDCRLPRREAHIAHHQRSDGYPFKRDRNSPLEGAMNRKVDEESCDVTRRWRAPQQPMFGQP